MTIILVKARRSCQVPIIPLRKGKTTMAVFQSKRPEVNLEIPSWRHERYLGLLFLACLLAGGGVSYLRQDAWGMIVGAILGGILAGSPRIAKQWERAIMNILYEGLKEKGALMLIPSTAVESMGLGGCWVPPHSVSRPSVMGPRPPRPTLVLGLSQSTPR